MNRVLFICSSNSGRSQIAQAFAAKVAPVNVKLFAVGDAHHIINPVAGKVMAETGLEIPKKVALTVKQISSMTFDIVITLCNNARETCPSLPGAPARIHWGLSDPSTEPGDIYQAYIDIRDEIEKRVNSFFSFGYFQSIVQIRQTYGALLNNLTDGVMAHDLLRKVFFFNRAAEKITGHKYADLIGRDCHEIFAGKFCQGACSYCDESRELKTKLRYPVVITRKDGKKRDVEMSVMPIKTDSGQIEGAMIIFRDTTEINRLRRVVDGDKGFFGIVGRDPKMKKVFDAIRELADVDVPVLIQGESGTGKEMVAYALHALSKRSAGIFVPINCGALPEGTLESELFGHVRGAFTGAIRDKKGRFELADKGTLFLDEIGEITPAMQVKLLRVLQEKIFMPVGGEKSLSVDVRVISAGNKDIKALTRKGLFREDLYYRVSVIPISLPPLRERLGDIPLLVEHFLKKFSKEIGKEYLEISHHALELLTSYQWPGNIRELRNAIQYALIKCKADKIEVAHLPPEISANSGGSKRKTAGRRPKLSVEAVRSALTKAGGNKAKAARALGVSRTTLYRYIRENHL